MIERYENAGKMICDYQLCSNNLLIAPKGVIRIARFETAFHPMNNRGYYGDIYMKKFIRKWRTWTSEIKQKRKERFIGTLVMNRIKIINDIKYSILQFI
uniref:Uncharacterized protein n=1 Tax=viral metagenome TaxID=1070528 RepID=A0A6C0EQM7_9ZZZZ